MADFTKDPDSKLIYSIDWTLWLNGDTIAESSWILPAAFTKLEEGSTDTKTAIKISGGVNRTAYKIVNHIKTTNTEEEEDQTVCFYIEEN